MSLASALAGALPAPALPAPIFPVDDLAPTRGRGSPPGQRPGRLDGGLAAPTPPLLELAPAQAVLQLAPLPVTLDPAQFAGARSPSNPGGDLRPLRAFRDLADPVPGFATYYSPQGSTEGLYSALVAGAQATSNALLAQQVIAKARQTLAEQAIAGLDGAPGTWLPVYATPVDWADQLSVARFTDLDLDLTEVAGSGAYATIGTQAPVVSLDGRSADPDSAATLVAGLVGVRLRYLLVELARPWLDPLIFRLAGWTLPPEPAGFVSSGSLAANDGVLPLVTTGLLVARTIDTELTAQARSVLAGLGATTVSVGPISLTADPSPDVLHVVAWVSALTPRSPEDPPG